MVLSGYQRYGTISTMTVAALGNLYVGIMLRSRLQAAGTLRGYRAVDGNIASYGAKIAQQLVIIELSIELVDFGNLLLQLIAIALRQTAHDVQLLEPAALLALYEFQYSVDALLFRALDESAGIDNRNLALRPFRVMDAVVALIGKLAHQFLGVDEILRASHRNKINTILLHKKSSPTLFRHNDCCVVLHYCCLNNESTNSFLLKSCKSSIPSPRPIYFTGTFSWSLMPITTPPLAVPSSLVMAKDEI